MKTKKWQPNPNSEYNQQMEELRDEGTLTGEKKAWNDTEIDLLLEGFLVHEYKYKSKRDCFLKVHGRTIEGIGRMLWKLATRYERDIIRKYTPLTRTDRTDTPFTPRDMAIVTIAIHEVGRKNKAHWTKWLSKVLGRSRSEIKQWYKKIVKRSPVLMKEPNEGESMIDFWARIASQTQKVVPGALMEILK